MIALWILFGSTVLLCLALGWHFTVEERRARADWDQVDVALDTILSER